MSKKGQSKSASVTSCSSTDSGWLSKEKIWRICSWKVTLTLSFASSSTIACTKHWVIHLSFLWAKLQWVHLTMGCVKESPGIFLLQLRQQWYWPKLLIPRISQVPLVFVKDSGSSAGWATGSLKSEASSIVHSIEVPKARFLVSYSLTTLTLLKV